MPNFFGLLPGVGMDLLHSMSPQATNQPVQTDTRTPILTVETGVFRAPRPQPLRCSRYWIVTVTGIEWLIAPDVPVTVTVA